MDHGKGQKTHYEERYGFFEHWESLDKTGNQHGTNREVTTISAP
jgi:hypothetical protein